MPENKLNDQLILIVEDDDALALLITRTLEKVGLSAASVSSGEAALAYCADDLQQVTLVLVDYCLPDMTGQEIIDRLRQAGSNVPFIVMTGHGDERLASDMIKFGARDYLVKDSGFLEALPTVVHRVVKEVETENRLQIAESKLRESLRAKSTLMSHLPGMAYRCLNDRNWTMEIVSKGCKELTGYDPNDLVGNRCVSYGSLIHSDDADYVWNEIQKSMAQKQPFQLEYRIRTAEGEEKWVWEKGETVFSESGKIQAIEGFITDTTERKQAEAALRNSELRLREAQRIGAVGDWEYNHITGKVYWSDQVFRLFERDPEQGPPSFEENMNYYHDDDSRLLQDQVCRALKNGEEFDTDYHIKLSDGRTAYQRGIIRVKKDEAGKVISLFGTVQDITERKEAEKAIKQSQESLTLAQQIAHIGNWDWNIKTNELQWSDEIYRIFGLEPQEFGATYEAFLQSVHPDDRELVQKGVQDAIEKGIPYSIEHRIVLKNGQERHVHERGEVTFDTQNKPIRIIGTVQEITERKVAEKAIRESEAKYQDLYDNAPDMYCSVDAITAKVRQCNKTLARALGLDQNEINGRKIFDLYHPDSLDGAKAAFNTFVTTGEVRDAELQLKRADGSKLDVSLNVSSVRNARGNINYSRSVWRDITQRKQAGAELAKYTETLKQTNAKLKHQQAEMEEFIYTISHDLKAPLVSIQGFTKLLIDEMGENLNDKVNKYLERIASNNLIMATHLHDLLELSRIGRMDEKSEKIDLRKQIEDIFGSFSSISIDHRIDLKTTGNIPEVIGCPKRVRALLTNLIDNALKYMPRQAGAMVEVGYDPEAHSGDGHRGALYVRDNSDGIPEQFHKRVFQIFQRARLDDEETSGTGVGLAIAKRIIETHGGKIWLKSAPGQGATFYFTLPLVATSSGYSHKMNAGSQTKALSLNTEN